ncbi:MAG: prepilin-type N-terminal cleavage/methylation domain-containing protein [Burkholderiales bacterium]|nr:prepilin-type N-terminal cleavage/methylation domain-containing protein [Burkholderiales bacterium]
MRAPQRQHGYTLVEIAIVLVIAGLLLGGVLRGQEMATQARIRDMINDMNGLGAAYHFYYDRYKALPGDDPRAAARWGAALGAKSGGGDGVVSGRYMEPAPIDPTLGAFTVDNSQNESLAFWWHLRMGGFVFGPSTGVGAATQPSNSVGGLVGVQTGGLNFSSLIVCESNVRDKIAGAVDTQMDDQRPHTGLVRAYQQAVPNEDITGKTPSGTSYPESGAGRYVICKTL